MAELLNVTPLPNGWLLEEYQWEHPVLVGTDSLSGDPGRFYCSVMRVPSTRKVRVGHYAGATVEERQAAARFAVVASSGAWRSGWCSTIWQKFKFREANAYYWRARIGTRIDVAEAFESLTRGVEVPVIEALADCLGAPMLGGAL